MAEQNVMEKIVLGFQGFVDTYGLDYIATTSELIHFVHIKYNIKEKSIIPSDYCYNLINNGIDLSKPTLFEHIGWGKYRCLGKNYSYNGNVYHNGQIVGICKNGERKIFGISDNPIENQQKNSRRRREPSTRLRFEVLYRDQFTCRFCGASPTKDPSVTLHIDHIVPWSKGGETSLDNLQTLCSKCNLGKSDLMIDIVTK